MQHIAMPGVRPASPLFSSGPTAKRPGWSLENLKNAPLGRSHRSAAGRARLKRAIDLTGEILGIPEDYRIAIVPASDTGAIEMALWSMLGPRGVEVLAWEAFGKDWIADIVDQLKLSGVTVKNPDYGILPDLASVDFDNDVVFTWNGTAAGVRVPDGDWIAAERKGLTICDATSAVFAQPLDWDKLDVATFSWQKVLGGEAAHGMLIVSPRAVQRLESYSPPWPLPKIFRMTANGKLMDGIFAGATINTPSMLCVEDYLDALGWVRDNGGLAAMHARADANAQTVWDWIDRTAWVTNLAADPATRSNTGVCMRLSDQALDELGEDAAKALPGRIVTLLEGEGVAFDFGAYRDAPPGLRIWTGGMVERSDLVALLAWIDWAYAQVSGELAA